MAVIPQLSVAKFRKDLYLLIEGKLSDGCFFIVQDGFVKLSKQIQLAEEKDMSVMGPGDFVGIVPAMSKRCQIETAQTVTDSTLLSVHISQFESLIQCNTSIVMKIMQQFSRRIRFINNVLSNIYVSNSAKIIKDDASVLFQLGEYYSKQNMNRYAHYIFRRYSECYPDGADIQAAQAKEKLLEKYSEPDYESSASHFARVYKEGSLIFAEGELGNELYIITKGFVKITRILNGTEMIVAVLKEGEIFGEMAILEYKPRSATAVALEDVTLIVVLKNNFASMAKTQPQVLFRLTCMLSERIWFGYKQLSNAMIKDPIGRVYNYLMLILEKNNIQHKTGMSYFFDFNIRELMKMVSVPIERYGAVGSELLNSRNISQINGKLSTSDVEEIYKLGTYYEKRNKQEANRIASS
jgi:CRP-like cAMP-binding protein